MKYNPKHATTYNRDEVEVEPLGPPSNEHRYMKMEYKNNNKIMNKEFIPYEQALELKELGFNEQCFAYYDCERDLIVVRGKTKFLTCEFAVPLYQQAFRWFREKYKVYQTIDIFLGEHNIPEYVWFTYENSNDRIENQLKLLESDTQFPSEHTYEEAELACLIKLIEIVKEKK